MTESIRRSLILQGGVRNAEMLHRLRYSHKVAALGHKTSPIEPKFVEQFIEGKARTVFKAILRLESSRDGRRGEGLAFSDVLSHVVALIPPGMRTVSMGFLVSVMVATALFSFIHVCSEGVTSNKKKPT